MKKLLQLKLYSLLSTKWGMAIFVIGLFISFNAILQLLTVIIEQSRTVPIQRAKSFAQSYSNTVCIPEIDIVYTWVNGSDPRQKAALQQTKNLLLGESFRICNSTETPEKDNCKKDEETASRFEDNEELRYSLRSVEKFAPWVRHIYLVTNGQIPYWLNISHPKITVVTHEEIFVNKSHLPTFSSPAIETHIHRIPGLSEKFLYLNDDTMFGNDIWPDDFFTQSGGQKIYLAWPVPNCNEGCPSSWIGDGYCDQACNVSECDFDFPDCVNKTSSPSPSWASQDWNVGGQKNSQYCSSGCPDSWIGDKYCDRSCRNIDCGFDAGDCDIHELFTSLFGQNVQQEGASFILPPGTNAAYFNLSAIVGENKIVDGSHDNSKLVRTATISQKHKIITITLHREIPQQVVQIFIAYEAAGEKHEFTFNVSASTVSGNETIEEVKNETTSTLEEPPLLNRPGTLDQEIQTSSVEDEPKATVDPDAELRDLLEKVGKQDETAVKKLYEAIENDKKRKPRKVIAPSPLNVKPAENEFLPKLKQESPVFKFQNDFPSITSEEEVSKEWQDLKHVLQMKLKEQVSIPVKSDDLGITWATQQALLAQWIANGKFSKEDLQTLDELTLKKLTQREVQLKEPHSSSFEAEGVYSNVVPKPIIQKEKEPTFSVGRKLLDMYGDSLKYVNKLLNKKFGPSARKVPAHMPHMIDKELMKELQETWADDFEATSSHQLRHKNDMQYAFSYFYFLIHQRREFNFTEIWQQFLDVDRDGLLNPNEFRSLAVHVNAGAVDEKTFNSIVSKLIGNNTLEETNITIETVRASEEIFAKLEKHFSKKPKNKYHTTDTEEVAFVMVGTNATLARKSLDGIRERRQKFVCLNDNINHTNPHAKEVIKALRDFYDSLLPLPSSFELPPGVVNNYTWVQDIPTQAPEEEAIETLNLKWLYIISGFAIVYCFCILYRCVSVRRSRV